MSDEKLSDQACGKDRQDRQGRLGCSEAREEDRDQTGRQAD